MLTSKWSMRLLLWCYYRCFHYAHTCDMKFLLQTIREHTSWAETRVCSWIDWNARRANFGISIFAARPENTVMQFGWSLFCLYRTAFSWLRRKYSRKNIYARILLPFVGPSCGSRENNGRYIMHSVSCTKRRRYLCLAYLHFSLFLHPTRKRA